MPTCPLFNKKGIGISERVRKKVKKASKRVSRIVAICCNILVDQQGKNIYSVSTQVIYRFSLEKSLILSDK